MDKLKQQIAIARAHGFNDVSDSGRYGYREDLCGNLMGGIRCSLPDYLNDLNAIGEVVATLPRWVRGETFEGTQEHFVEKLQAACHHPDGTASYFEIITATPAQRAEAFLKTLGLWTDE